jgi:hypothetical protein
MMHKYINHTGPPTGNLGNSFGIKLTLTGDRSCVVGCVGSQILSRLGGRLRQPLRTTAGTDAANDFSERNI